MASAMKKRSEGMVKAMSGGSGGSGGGKAGNTTRLRATSARVRDVIADAEYRKEVRRQKLLALDDENYVSSNAKSANPFDDNENLDDNDDEYEEEDDEVIIPGKKRRKKRVDNKAARRRSMSKKNYITNFNKVLEQSNFESFAKHVPTYLSIEAAPSIYPPRAFCSTCGFPSNYKCVQCGQRYCSIHCLEVHKENRCLKWTV